LQSGPSLKHGIAKEIIMAKAKTPVKTISDKLTKVNESFTINMYDNGYMIEVGGRNKKGDYTNAKILVSTVDELVELVREACDLERDD
jgi:hypothetical protein